MHVPLLAPPDFKQLSLNVLDRENKVQYFFFLRTDQISNKDQVALK